MDCILSGVPAVSQISAPAAKTEHRYPETRQLIRKLHETNPDVEANLYNTVRCVNPDKIQGYRRGSELHSFLDDY